MADAEGAEGTNQSIASSCYYVDAVSFDNQLVNEVAYIYYVTANSGQGITGRAVMGETIINDGSSSDTATAIIHKRGTKVTRLVTTPDT